MENYKIYKIDGVHCASCKALIEMELEDAGIEGCSVDWEQKQIMMPEEIVRRLEEIKEAVSKAGEYKLIEE